MEESNNENDQNSKNQPEETDDSDDPYAPFDPTAFLRKKNTDAQNMDETEDSQDKQNKPITVIRLRKPPPEYDNEEETENQQLIDQVNENQKEEIQPPKNEQKNEQEDTMAEEDKWKCPICLETLQQPVVTHCGHVFCYPCISEWLRRSNSCPVCHGQIDASHLIPIYGQGSEADVSSPPPPRPEYQEARENYAFNRFTPFQYTVNITMNNVRNFFHMTPQKALLLLSLIFLVLSFYV
ncbi:putative E3 ubiquitin-protein ligase RNF5 [Histomonas meleagridis]|uniref:putative E3 ubiquitin-protein ligase RNF5 n=1 Tax=Histomonas meleagridis TaxID=135588 RepID=UPI0035597519|nr:putative E3 ubiquitin-protein ligase RNF5 [Histomonas meleagridis]KAH0799434.1 putative E3 ubiquitin-protein ligase RNF5 [Histomonas meleagridis]